MTGIELNGIVESLIVTKPREIRVKTHIDDGRRLAYSGEISGAINGVHRTASGLIYEGRHQISAAYAPIVISGADSFSSNQLYVSTTGTALHYLIGVLMQQGGQRSPGQNFGEYVRTHVHSALTHDSLASLINAYKHFLHARDFGTTFEFHQNSSELENAYRLLRQYSGLIRPNEIINLVFLHDSNFEPVTRMTVGASKTVSKLDGETRKSIVVDDERIVGYGCDFEARGNVDFYPTLAAELMEIEGEFMIKLRKGRAKRMTNRVNTSYRLRGDWEANVDGVATMEPNALSYWKWDGIKSGDIYVDFKGELL